MRMHMLRGPEQDPGYIVSKPLWNTKAKEKTYLQGMFVTPRRQRLVVEITEKKAPNNRRQLIERIAKHIKNNNVIKEHIKSLRDSLLSTYDEHLVDRPSCAQHKFSLLLYVIWNVT